MEQVSKKFMEEIIFLKKNADTTSPLSILKVVNENETPEVYHYLYDVEEDEKNWVALMKHLIDIPQFEEQKPKKYVVKTKESDGDGDQRYLEVYKVYGFKTFRGCTNRHYATKFDTREEAEQYSNPLTEVVEVEDK